jgi:hypothetical protein
MRSPLLLRLGYAATRLRRITRKSENADQVRRLLALAAMVENVRSLPCATWLTGGSSNLAGLLLTAEGCSAVKIMRRTGIAKPTAWRQQKRSMTEGVPGLWRDKTPPCRIPPLGLATEQRVMSRTLDNPPGEITRWAAAKAKESASVRCSVSGAGMVCSCTGRGISRARSKIGAASPSLSAGPEVPTIC